MPNRKNISTDLTPENIAAVLALLEENPGHFAALAEGRDAAALARPLAPGERSITGNLAHILSCEARSSDFILQALLLKEPLIPKIHPERQLGKLWRLDTYPYAELLAYFNFRRKLMLGVLHSLNQKQWDRRVQEPGKQRRESVYWQARGQALHELDHLEDMHTKLEMPTSKPSTPPTHTAKKPASPWSDPTSTQT